MRLTNLPGLQIHRFEHVFAPISNFHRHSFRMSRQLLSLPEEIVVLLVKGDLGKHLFPYKNMTFAVNTLPRISIRKK
jgi:hypothetical protein